MHSNNIAWKPEYEIGHPVLDAQHRQLMDKINDLVAATENFVGEKELYNTFFFLQNFIEEHFSTEEKLMQSHKYPGYPYQKKAHDSFVADFYLLKEELNKDGPTIEVLAKLHSRLSSWLLDHILEQDMQFGVFLSKTCSLAYF